MLLLSDELITQELTLSMVIEWVEEAFSADARGNATTFPAIVQHVGLANAHLGIKSGYLRLDGECGAQEVIGLKAGGYWLHNLKRHGLPSHRATIMLINPDTGEALAVMPANVITRLRTAAAGAIAARYLAKQDAGVVTVVGVGEQGHAQMEALRLTRNISTLWVWGRRPSAVDEYVASWRGRGVDARVAADLPEALQESDILITTTPSTAPLVLDGWIRPGLHINAVGSDGAGKKELDPAVIPRAKFVADKTEQSIAIGELQGAAGAGAEVRKLVYAELGEICAGLKPGRINDEEITIFDSSGVSFQDLIVAHYLVARARQKGLGREV